MPDTIDLNADDFDAVAQQGGAGAEIPAAPTETQAPAPNPLFEEARSAGLDFGDDIKDSDGLARFLLSQYTSQKPYAEFGRSALTSQQHSEPQARVEAQQEDDGETEGFNEQDFFSQAWNVPALSAGAQWALQHGVFQEGRGGLLEPVQGLEQAALPYVKEINDYQRARAALHEQFSENPLRFVLEKGLPYLRHHLSQDFQRMSSESTKQYEESSFLDRFKSDNAAWLYNAQGTAFTEHGQRFSDLVAELQANGMTDLAKATQYALKIMPPPTTSLPTKEGGDPTDQPAPKATAAPSTERARDEQGRYLPAGTPAPAPKTAQEKAFLEKAKERAKATQTYTGRQTVESTVVANEGDLDSMWDNAWREHSAAAGAA